jgi:hypothetical protein
MARTKLVVSLKKGTHVTVPLTAAEEAKQDADNAKWVIDEQARADAEAQKAVDKAAGNKKLLDLGLNQAEVDAVTGQ